MNLEILFFIVIAFLLYDAYNNQYYTKMLLSYKKQYKFIGYIFLAFCVYLLFKRDPSRARDLLMQSTNFMKPFPIDLTSGANNSPQAVLQQNFLSTLGLNHLCMNPDIISNLSMGGRILEQQQQQQQQQQPIQQQKKKRSVSETKKKYVASQQDWKCGECKKTLNAWFEVDHKKRLEYGGSNEVDNLVALCRECHGKKTAFENM